MKVRFRPAVSIVLRFAFLLVLSSYDRPSLGQGFEVQSKSAPSVIEAGTFVSLEGRFSIALPQRNQSFSGSSLDTPVGRATGDSYGWRMKEGTFSAGFVDAPQSSVDAPQSSKEPRTGEILLATVRRTAEKLASANNGRLSERTIQVGKQVGTELRVEFLSGVIIHRLFLVSRRLYQVILVLKLDQRVYEAVALDVLDSFKVLDEADVAAVLKAEAAKAEPSPLPQEPVAKRNGTDANDDGLRGKVKMVLTESEDLSGTWSVQTRKRNSMEYYNERGYLTKRELYDYKGNLFHIEVFGYLDGSRASTSKSISHEYNPPAPMITSKPSEEKPKYDPRYSNKFEFKYDNQKRLVEKTWINSAGKLSSRNVYKYSGRQKEDWVYSADGSLNQHHLSVLDDKGNRIEWTIFEVRDGTVRNKYSYAYEFDAKGNWIKRTSSKWVTKDGRSGYEPSDVWYRTISYY